MSIWNSSKATYCILNCLILKIKNIDYYLYVNLLRNKAPNLSGVLIIILPDTLLDIKNSKSKERLKT
jgi:hypothetical protein